MRNSSWRMICLLMPLTLVSAVSLADGDDAKSARPKLDLKDETVRINYSLGYQVGTDFKKQGVKLDTEAVVQGIADALKGGRPQLSQPEMYTVLSDLKTRIVAAERKLKHKIMQEKIEEDKKFLEANKSKPGVKVTASGLQYKVIKQGTGKQPITTDTVTFKYIAMLTNKYVFDSTKARGANTTTALNSVFRGMREGLQLIKEGGKIQLFIPPKLGYGKKGPLAHRVLIFDIDLISVDDSHKK